jgi:hypothetical protein
MAETMMVIITIVLAWQAYYQNNVVIFDRRIKLYHEFCKIAFRINNLKMDISRFPFKKSAENNAPLSGVTQQDIKEITNTCMSLSIQMSAILEEMVFVFSNQNLIDSLEKDLSNHSGNICKYSSEIFNKTKTYNVSEIDYSESQEYFRSLWDEQNEIHILFKSQLQLRNLEYYFSKFKSKICILLGC